MASNGGVVAESNQDPAQCSARATVPASPAHPKPEVARKPHLPGNKPRPPVPKKPPVAQKPAPANHGSTAQAATPTSPPNNHNSDSTSPTASARLSHPDCVTQEAAPATVTQNAGPGQSLAAKSPPPPLPKSPPKGRPQAGKAGSKPPPRPGQPPAPRKSPPPVPIKRPVGRSPVLPERRKAEQAGPSIPQREPLRSYEQVVVEENLKAGVDDRQIAGSEHSLCKTTHSSLQKPRPYQQVVVEENCDDGSEACRLSSAEKQSARRPQSYENIVLREKSKSQNSMPQTSALGPLRSYEDVLVEENSQPDSDLRDKQKGSDHHRGEKTDTLLITGSTANSLTADEGVDGQKQTANSDASGQDGITQAADHQTDLGSKNPLTASGLHSDDVYTEVTEDKNCAPTHSAGETEPPSDPANLQVEKHSGEGSGHLLPEPLKENSSKGRPPRPCPTPPPVRPKPRKRISLLRQSLVTEEGPKEPNPPAVAAESREPCHSNVSAPGFEVADSPVQEALYQEIDELEQPGQKLTESSSSCETESSLGPGFVGNSPGSEEVNQNQEQICTSGDQRQKLAQGSVKGADAQGSIKDAVDSLQTVGSRAPEAPKDSGRLSPDVEAAAEQTGEIGESGDQTGAADASRKSPEKHNPITLQDVGETSFMLKEIEQLLNVRLGSGEGASDTDSSKPAEASDTPTTSQTESTPVRPPRPRRMDKLRKLTIGSVDSSSTESLTGVGQSGKKAPPKPKRKHLPGPMSRSQSDVTGMKNYIDQLKDGEEEEEEEKPSLPPRQQSLRLSSEPKPPPLPPRNKSMEHAAGSQAASSPKLSEGHVREEKPGERRSSAPNVGGVAPTKVVRSSTSGVRQGRKHIPRPTRKAPPPPSHPPSRPLSVSTPQSSNLPGTPSTSVSGKVPGYQKITNGSVSASNDINTVVPKTAVVGCIDSPCVADASTDHDYHEIPEHLVQDVEEKDTGQQEPTKSVEGTPPPDLPPRSYNPPSGPSEPAALTSSDPAKEEDSEAETPQDKPSDQLSAEDSTSQSSQMSSRPESFCSEVMGSLLHVVGDQHRPVSMHSSSSHSETGSGDVEVPTFDHSSASESENEDDEDRLRQKREKKVYYIAEEVVKSEQVFVDVLKLLNVDFRTFMSSKTEQAGHPIVPTETLNKILDFLPQLLSFNEMLLKDLTDRIANWEKHKKLADIFVKKGPFLKLYSSYIRNFEHATALLDETCKKHSGFGMALQQFEMSPRCANLALKHYMLKPIQRIPQYKLLLQDYLKHLTPESADYKDTLTALNIVSEVADHANESMRHGDDVQKLLEIQRSLIGQFEVIQPGRVLIKQGELMKLSRKDMQPRMFFLFSDVLLYTTPTATGYRLNNILPLQGMKVLPPKLEEFKNEFNIISTQRSFTVATSTPEEREEWLRALWNAIEENSERYHTFKAKQSEPKTSLLDKDFVLGTKAPLWVPDARVTMCMLCLAEFSITWRRHHCRGCGRIICGNCSENKAPLRYLMYKPARVCDECFEKLAREVDERLEKDQKSSVEDPSTSPGRPTSTASATGSAAAAASSDALGLSFSSIKARFQKIRRSARERRKLGLARPSVLKEVHANDEGSDMSGYLWVAKNKKWKRLWFVVKGKVLYTYKASEDMAAIESMPLLGFEVTRMTSWYQGAEPDLMFELQHQNTQPLVFKPRTTSTSSGSDRNSATDDGSAPSPTVVSPHVKSSADTTTPRLIFRTDSAAATTKWLTVLREASLA